MSLNGNDLIGSARRIAEGLLTAAHPLDDGSLSWGRGAGRERQPVADSGPFNGRSGEAMLFAALHRVTGSSEYRDAALRTLETLRRNAADPGYRARLYQEVAHGLEGVGGIIYVLVRAGELLDEPSLVTCAARLAEFVTPEFIAHDDRYDVIWGLGGVIPALLALSGTGNDTARAQAVRCGDRLLEQRKLDPETGHHAWPTQGDQLAAGFAHGAAGIAYALLQLYRCTGDERYYDAALDAFRFERGLYREDIDHWPDTRTEPPDQPAMRSWCHGAPGIALARLSALDHVRGDDESAIADDLMKALRAMIHPRRPAVDSMCCGYFGRVDILLEAGLQLENPSLVRQAWKIAETRLERAERDGFSVSPSSGIPPHRHPGLWQGEGGIAYVLLRLAAPDIVPCVLAIA